ncbi:MAG TPA: DUF4142 domain-containing protein [Chryseosolibacter sp.]|nr:DUF4142 domain-containing protein [Chryseosolibacter sp.]
MKATTVIYFAIISLFSCDGGKQDSVRLAHEENLNSAIDERISEFMTQAADAHMLALQQAELAVSKSSSPHVTEFATWMAAEQKRLLQNLRMLAAQKNIILPQAPGNRSAENLEDLKEEEDLDKAFINAMQKNYKDVVDIFEDGTDVRDEDVQLFAKSNLPVVESHLARIEEMEQNTPANNPVTEDNESN